MLPIGRASENNKGKFCWIKDDVFCQEGWCSGCRIYHDVKLCHICGANLDVWEEMMLGEHNHYKGEIHNGVELK